MCGSLRPGTIRTYDAGIRAAVHRDIRQIAENIAASAKAEVVITELYDPLVNNEHCPKDDDARRSACSGHRAEIVERTDLEGEADVSWRLPSDANH